MYLLPKPKTIKEQDGQMLLCHSTHIVMTKEVAETEMHAAKRLQEAIRQSILSEKYILMKCYGC